MKVIVRTAEVAAVAFPFVLFAFGGLWWRRATLLPIGPASVASNPAYVPAGWGGGDRLDPYFLAEGWIVLAAVCVAALVLVLRGPRPPIPQRWRLTAANRVIVGAALRAVGITVIAVPLVWLALGGTATWPADVAPFGLRNLGWRPDPARPAYFISFAGWQLLGLVFLVAILVPIARRWRQGDPPGRRPRRIDAALILLGGGVLAACLVLFGINVLAEDPIVTRLSPDGGICSMRPGPCP